MSMDRTISSIRSGAGLEEKSRPEEPTLSIAQVAPLYESVPPRLYGGTERIVAYITEELVAMGHDVTLFASGDSRTKARLIAGSPRSLRLDPTCRDPLAHHIVMLERVMQESARFDVIHFHCDYIHYPLSRRLAMPTLTTLHGRLDLPDLLPVYREFPEMPLISISDAQRVPLPDAAWRATIHHGLPPDFGRKRGEGGGDYLAFLGRISPEKRVDRAIEIALRSGMALRIAAKVDPADQGYFEEKIHPLLGEPGVEFLGEISEEDKEDFLAGAYALLFPIDWPEPFGLVMIEAMACGTPVIAFRRGSVPEVIDDGRTGFVVNSVDEAVDAVGRVGAVRREECRATFERRFTARRMAEDYVTAYRALLGAERPARLRRSSC
jgi:glycosyltransferase involved in cell wall biosynthesis